MKTIVWYLTQILPFHMEKPVGGGTNHDGSTYLDSAILGRYATTRRVRAKLFGWYLCY